MINRAFLKNILKRELTDLEKEELQEYLVRLAVKDNTGICCTYNYCGSCKEPNSIRRTSLVPCCDAYIEMCKKEDKIKTPKKKYIGKSFLINGLNIDRKSLRGKRKSKNTRILPKSFIIEQYNEDMNLVNVFNSFKEAYQKTGIKDNNIRMVCYNNIGKTGGYLWMIKEKK